MDNIVLIGFMGSGKSSVGRYLARKFQWKFIDTDQYIENREGRKISRIFSEDGEEAFRRMETEVLKELIADGAEHIVLAVGGGLPVRKENRDLLKRFGTVFYLKATLDTLERRLSGDTSRPLLQGGSLREKIAQMMEQRGQIYRSLADCEIRTDKESFEKIGQAIQEYRKETAS